MKKSTSDKIKRYIHLNNYLDVPAIIVEFILIFLMFSGCMKSYLPEPSHSSSGHSGIVAAGEKPSVLAGLEMLKMGGTAADAAAASILALTITDYGAFCIGGEVPLIYYDAAKKDVKVFSGQGTAPHDPQTVQWYMENGIPPSSIKAAAVPAVIDLCITVMKEYGKLSFSDVVTPTLNLLQNGDEEWYPDLSKTFQLMVQAENELEGNRTEKLQAVSDRFYRGDIADELVKWYQSEGGLLTKDDLAGHQTRIEEPISIQYGDFTICKCNTWTQGPVLLQSLKLLNQLKLDQYDHLSAEYIHLVTEVLKLALADRDHWYGDPAFEPVPLEQLLSDEYAALRAPLIDMDQASNQPRPGDPVNMKPQTGEGVYESWDGGTTTCCVADQWGNVVAATPSGWGSEAGPGGTTGITHGTRLRSLNTTPGHPNCIKPGKRPRITLTPTMVLKNNIPIMAVSVAGGDLQDQTALNLILSILNYGLTAEEAVSVSRFSTNLHEDSFDPSTDRFSTIDSARILTIYEGLDAGTIQELEKKGHKIDEITRAIGAPVILLFDEETGMWTGATDPKIDHYTGALN